MNLIIITGNLGQDAQEKAFPDSTKYWVLNIATTEKWNNKDGEKQEKTTWHRCQLTGKYDKLIPYLRKGQQVCVNGLQRHEQYDFKDQATNQPVMFGDKPIKMTMSFIRVNSIELLGGAKNDTQAPAAAPQAQQAAAPQAAAPQTQAAPQVQQPAAPEGADDLPF